MFRGEVFIGDIKVKKITTSLYSLVEVTSLKELFKNISSVIQYMVVDFEERGEAKYGVGVAGAKRKLLQEN